jgi:hypothetical protein
MYASIRRYQLTDGSMDDLLHLVDTDFAESISDAEGFVGYEVLDCDDGRVCTISIFRDRESALASDALAMEWVRSTLSPQFALTRTDTMLGEVAVSRVAREMLEPAHH